MTPDRASNPSPRIHRFMLEPREIGPQTSHGIQLVIRGHRDIMNRRLLSSLALLGSFPAALIAQLRPTLRPADYGKWESLGQGSSLSPNGRWLAYTVNRVNEENEL